MGKRTAKGFTAGDGRVLPTESEVSDADGNPYLIDAASKYRDTSYYLSIAHPKLPTKGSVVYVGDTYTFEQSGPLGGDDELGEKLMGNFLSTLPELGESLWRVILLNGGVKLAATPGKALDSLKALENAGTDVLVCGTCLDFYGLLEAKQAGQTTNMLDVVTSLALADKVIRP